MMSSETRKLDPTYFVLAILILQTALSAGIFLRLNQLRQEVINGGATARATTMDTAPVDVALPDDAPSVGPAGAPVTIVEFADFGCAYCRAVRPTLAEVAEQYGEQVRIVYRHFPLGGADSASFAAALAAECAGEQDAFWGMHDLLFENQPAFDNGSLERYASSLGLDTDQFKSCMESRKYQSRIERDADDGRSYGVNATPTFFINGRRVVGSMPLGDFQGVINEALQTH